MPPASMNPTFPATGAPLSVLVDYDGTISREDVVSVLLDRHVVDRVALAQLEAAYEDGAIGSRALMRWDMDVLPRDAKVLTRDATSVPQDEGFVDLVRVTRAHGGVVEVVSDGLGFYIEPNLARLGLTDVPVATNGNSLRDGGAGVGFPYGHPDCLVCGTCKRERVRLHQAAGRVVVFVGDGPSDRYAANHADVVFAKGQLDAWCATERLPARPWRDLADVTTWLEIALIDGELPRDAREVAAWRADRGDRRPAFICGPEVWGEGRTVPLPLVGLALEEG